MPRNLGFSDGSSMSVDRTREAGVRTLGFSDGSSLKVNRATGKKDDRAGESRPLLGKLVGRSAIAFSLRDLHDKQGNNKVVRVRRGADNFEKDFKANELYSIVDWTNGKLDTTLPTDVASADAAYSLRKVKANYSDNVVRIRRTSDDIEVEVGFDSEGKVSASSPITDGGTELTPNPDADLGSTTATTLGDFLTEDINIFTDSSSQSWANIRSTDSFETSTALGGEVNYRKFTPNSGVGTSALLGIGSFFDVSASSTYTISGKVYVPSGQTTVNAFKIVNGTSGSSPSLSGATNTVPTTDQWVDFSFTNVIPTSTQFYINSAKDQNAFFSPNGTDFIAFKDITVTATDSGATVHTWYDQAGSDNATQSDATKQPKIAENGGLLADGISFDGVNSFLNTGGVFSDNREASIFIKVKALTSDATGSDWFYTEGYSGENGSVAQTIGVGITDTGNIADIIASTDINANDGQASVLANGGVISLIGGTSTTASHINGTSMGSITTPTNADGNYTITTSGGIGGHSSTSSLAKFSMEELILYASDQSANRFKIESNINNYYNLYTSNTNSAFVDIWYDQGGGNYHFTQDDDTLQPTIVNNGVYYGGLHAPVNNATSGSKVHMKSNFRNQSFPANTTGISYFLVGNDLSADQGNNKGTLIGSFRGVANYAEGQQGIALDGGTKFGFYNGLTTNANHYQYKTVVVPNSTFPNKTVLLVASIQDKTATLYVNESTNSGNMVRVGGTELENLNLESDASVDADRHYIRLFAPNRDLAYRAHNYSYGTIKEAILYPSSNSDNLEAIRDNINNQYQIY